jgi:hypothetical protein
MRKVLVSLRGGQNNDLAGDDIPAEWSRLHDELTKLCRSGEADRQCAVNTLLAEAEKAKWPESRNNVVHGYWWLVPMGEEFVMARYFHQRQIKLQRTRTRPPSSCRSSPDVCSARVP